MPAASPSQRNWRWWARVALCALGSMGSLVVGGSLCAETAATPAQPAVWSLSYRRIAELPLPEPWATWWQSAAAREALRWRTLSGASGDAAAWLSAVRAASLTISTQHRPERHGMLGEISGWCQGPLTAPATAALLGAWPGRQVSALPDGVVVTDPDLRPDLAEPPPGWRIRLDRATALALAHNQLSLADAGNDLDLLALVLPDGLSIRVSEAASAHWVFGGAQLARRLDARRLSLLPDGQAVAIAIGIDGAGLGAAFDRLRASHALEEGDEQKRSLDQIARLLRAIDGTCLLGLSAEGELVVSLPRTAALDAAIGALDAPLAGVSDGEAQELGGVQVLRTRESWMFASKLEALEPWRAPARAAELPIAPDAWCAGTVGAESLAQWTLPFAAQLQDLTTRADAVALGQDDEGVDAQGAGGAAGNDAALCMGRALARPMATAEALAAGVRDAGSCHLIGGLEHGQLRLDVLGAAAAWLPIAIALYEARNTVFYDCGMRRLGETLARGALAGRTSEDADPSQAQLLPRWRSGRALRRRIANLSQLGPIPEAETVWSAYTERGDTVGVADQAAALLAQADGLIAATAVLEDPQLPSITKLAREEAGAAQDVQAGEGQGEAANDLPGILQLLLHGGASLVTQGDLRGLTLIARADRVLAAAGRVGLAPPLGAHGSTYDQAVFAACELGYLDGDAARTALDHQLAPGSIAEANALPSLLAAAANAWKPDPRSAFDPAGEGSHGLFSLPAELAAGIDARAGAHGGIPVLSGTALSQLGLPLPIAHPLIQLVPLLEHRMMRRALELLLRARAGSLPEDEDALARAIGPLTETCGPYPIRLRYLRYRDGGFLLENEVDDDVDLGGNLTVLDAPDALDHCADAHLSLSGQRCAWHPRHHQP